VSNVPPIVKSAAKILQIVQNAKLGNIWKIMYALIVAEKIILLFRIQIYVINAALTVKYAIRNNLASSAKKDLI